MCTERYISPFTDFGFKLLFGTPANKEFLIHFLNSLFDGEEVITDISYNNTEVFGKAPDQRLAYEASLKNMRDYMNTINSAEERGVMKGLEQGFEIGREEGMELGAELKAKNIARSMKEAGIEVKTIASFTGLPESEINAL